MQYITILWNRTVPHHAMQYNTIEYNTTLHITIQYSVSTVQ